MHQRVTSYAGGGYVGMSLRVSWVQAKSPLKTPWEEALLKKPKYLPSVTAQPHLHPWWSHVLFLG